jgi:hypothetical protein
LGHSLFRNKEVKLFSAASPNQFFIIQRWMESD